ncbi:hypothetical protein N9971_00635 [bacterium]|nr:hypothetical protein [bacterium]
MERSTRTLLIIGVMGIVSVVALMGLASRYNKVLEQRNQRSARRVVPAAPAAPQNIATLELPAATAGRSDASEESSSESQALAYLDAFLNARASIRSALESTSSSVAARRLEVLQSARAEALDEQGMTLSDYRQLRTLWRQWQEDGSAPTLAFEQAFRARADRLADAGLGSLESFD